MARQIDRPNPVPPYLRVVEVSAWWKAENSLSRCAADRPIPVSRTAKRHFPGSGAGAMEIAISPRSVNFTALPTRLKSTWRRRNGSPSTASGSPGSSRANRRKPLAEAAGSSALTTVSTTRRGASGTRSISSLPASIFEKSRMSPMIWIRLCAASWAMPASSDSSAESGWRRSSSSVPITPLSGVRISWLITARNSDFARAASSAAAAASRNALSSFRRSPISTPTVSTPAMAPVSSRTTDLVDSQLRGRPAASIVSASKTAASRTPSSSSRSTSSLRRTVRPAARGPSNSPIVRPIAVLRSIAWVSAMYRFIIV